ncbi:MAG TPA: FHA domain-containing protein [Ignavibacteria bacterium]
MKCSKCGRENKTDETFCASCGSRISSGTVSPEGTSQKFSGGVKKTAVVQPIGFDRNFCEVFIGRGSNCDIVINDDGVSTKHSRIFVENDEIFIEDLRSLNGTYVNGRRISSRTKIGLTSKVFLGNFPLDMRNPAISSIFAKYGTIAFSDSGVLSFRVNPNWSGKLFYFAMVIFLFLPWLTIKGGTESITFSALDFAFNKFPNKDVLSGKLDYGPLHTMFLSIFILVLIGLFLNFFKMRIAAKFNWTNIVSLIIFILTLVYMYIVSSVDTYIGGTGSFAHNFSAFMFIFICFISIFEGVIEYYINANTY